MADIELVVKMSENLYKATVNGLDANGIWDLRLAIANGTPLPKGHGRLGDLDALRDEVSSWGMNDYEPEDFIDAIDDVPTVEAIPKADYETRLKADMVKMLTELKNELTDISWNIDMYDSDLDFECCYLNDIDKVIKQKINTLRGAEHE